MQNAGRACDPSCLRRAKSEQTLRVSTTKQLYITNKYSEWTTFDHLFINSNVANEQKKIQCTRLIGNVSLVLFEVLLE